MTTLQIIGLILAALVASEIALILAVLANKVRHRRREAKRKAIRTALLGRYFQGTETKIPGSPILRAEEFTRLCEQIQLDRDQQDRAYADFRRIGLIPRLLRELNCPSSYLRKRAAHFLTFFPTTESRLALIDRLRKEKLGHVKVFLVDALKKDMDQYTVSTFIESLVGSRRFYQARLIEIFKEYLLSSQSHFPDIWNRPEPEIREMFVDIAESLVRQDFQEPLVRELAKVEDHLSGNLHSEFVQMKIPRLRRHHHHLLRVLSGKYGWEMETEKYLRSDDPEVVKIAILSMAKTKTWAQVEKILSSADGQADDESRVDALTEILESNRMFYDRLLLRLPKEENPALQKLIAAVLVRRIDFLILKLHAGPDDAYGEVIRKIVLSGSRADLIGFLNRNRNRDVETRLWGFLRPLEDEIPEFGQELADFLTPETAQRLKVKAQRRTREKRPKSKPDRRKTKWITGVLIAAFGILPLLFVILEFPLFGQISFWEVLKNFVILMNEIFIGYFLSVNLVYLILAAVSTAGTAPQSRLWALKGKAMLFERGMLPSISIIAPAYNEEKTIVSSINSLMNLNYPDFEVIVVNDGSADATLQELITHFNLERKNVRMDARIKTRPVMAVYRNRVLPMLTVVDKLNGGKADALNAGINFAENDYVCGIDADSLLESESLLKLMSSILDHDQITLALGGCIFPVNGCTVDHGQIEHKGLAKNLLARLQTIEYLRAFSLARVGWSLLDSLLIVSGAFGLFEKQIIAECGGYLTESAMDRDTVGEDMELVVRITKRAHRTRLRFRIDFLHNAVCYTEVPEELPSLLRQRNRWQRGLVDILSYHRDMILNPRFKNAGMLGMAYYFIFEMMGPLLEIQGILAVAAGLIFGILNLEIVLILFIVTVMLGMNLSLWALLVTERDAVSLSPKETFRLLLLAVGENFGWRQFIALYRIKGIFSSLKDANAWGNMQRVGFRK